MKRNLTSPIAIILFVSSPLSWLFLAFCFVRKIPWTDYTYPFTIFPIIYWSFIDHLLYFWCTSRQLESIFKEHRQDPCPGNAYILLNFPIIENWKPEIFIFSEFLAFGMTFVCSGWNVRLKFFPSVLFCLSHFFLYLMWTLCLELQQPLLNMMTKVTHSGWWSRKVGGAQLLTDLP